MYKLNGALSDYNALTGTLNVFSGDLSRTQFEQIWDKIVERIDSSADPLVVVVDDSLNDKSKHPVENRVITKAIDNLYNVFPTEEFNGDSNNKTFIIEDGADGIPLDNLFIEIGPNQNGTDDPSPTNVRLFKKLEVTFDLLHEWKNAEGGTETSDIMCEFDPNGYNNIYAGQVDFKEGIIRSYTFYKSYDGELLTGPWLSSHDVYSEGGTPTIGAQVIDFGSIDRVIDISLDAYKDFSMKNATVKGWNKYTFISDEPFRSFKISCRADPKAYVDMATGLTEAQRRALIDLLDE